MDTGDTAWMLTSAAFVLFMFPGLALFYGGMVRSKAVLNMMMMSFTALFVVAILWMAFGYSAAFGDSYGGAGILGNLGEYFGLKGTMGEGDLAGTFPSTVFVTFQLMFAGLTVALISGAVAERMKFGAWIIFSIFWASIVYFPVAHWVFAFDGDGTTGGWIANKLAAIDFAGGTAVHINAGAAALALALVLGRRKGFGKQAIRPHNLPLVMLGSGILWFGWYGFNAGSAVSAGWAAGAAMLNTTIATAGAALAWLVIEKLRDGHATSLGASSGVVAGLVAITPSCGAVDAWGALAIGVVAGAVCAWAVTMKNKLGYDDSLDVVGVHLVGGLIGTLLIGLVATDTAPNGVNGLFYGGGLDQLWRQAVAAAVVLVYSFVIAYLIGIIIHKTMGARIDEDAEVSPGIDQTVHAEGAYEIEEVVRA